MKKGDKVVILECNNTQPPEYLNAIVEVISDVPGHYFYGKLLNDNTIPQTTFYYTGPEDKWELWNKDYEKKYIQEKIEDNKAKIEKLVDIISEAEANLNMLKNYESEEEYLLEQLDLVFEGDDKKSRINALKAVRKKLL